MFQKSANEGLENAEMELLEAETSDFYEEKAENTEESGVEEPIFEEPGMDEVEYGLYGSSENRLQEVDKTDFKKSEKQTLIILI